MIYFSIVFILLLLIASLYGYRKGKTKDISIQPAFPIRESKTIKPELKKGKPLVAHVRPPRPAQPKQPKPLSVARPQLYIWNVLYETKCRLMINRLYELAREKKN